MQNDVENQAGIKGKAGAICPSAGFSESTGKLVCPAGVCSLSLRPEKHGTKAVLQARIQSHQGNGTSVPHTKMQPK